MSKTYSLENNSSECDSPHVAAELPLIFVIHKNAVSKKWGDMMNFRALTGITTNLQLVNEEEFCLQILKAL